ncbi:hypothetical protein FQZ97_1076480 [compost metagenome]
MAAHIAADLYFPGFLRSETVYLQRWVAFPVQVFNIGTQLFQRFHQETYGPFAHPGSSGHDPGLAGHRKVGGEETHSGAGVQYIGGGVTRLQQADHRLCIPCRGEVL